MLVVMWAAYNCFLFWCKFYFFLLVWFFASRLAPSGTRNNQPAEFRSEETKQQQQKITWKISTFIFLFVVYVYTLGWVVQQASFRISYPGFCAKTATKTVSIRCDFPLVMIRFCFESNQTHSIHCDADLNRNFSPFKVECTQSNEPFKR